MKIIIIDNNNSWLKSIEKITNETLSNTLEMEVISFKKYNNKLKDLIFDGTSKIYVIDYELDDEINGNDIAHEIREDAFDWKSIIIMISIYNRKCCIITKRLCIYTYIAKDRSFKPNLQISIKSAINILNSHKLIEIKENRQKFKIPINEIVQINKEKLTKYCNIKTLNNNVFRVRTSLSEINKQLNFKRINNHTLINPNQITRLKLTNKNN